MYIILITFIVSFTKYVVMAQAPINKTKGGSPSVYILFYFMIKEENLLFPIDSILDFFLLRTISIFDRNPQLQLPAFQVSLIMAIPLLVLQNKGTL